MTRIGILGAGTWGIALASMLTQSGNTVTVWSALDFEIETLSRERKHKNLPGMVIPDGVLFTNDIKEAVKDEEIVIFATPSVFIRETARKALPFLSAEQIIVSVAKGIEEGTLMTMSEILHSVTGSDKIVALSGPTHAEEVSLGIPTVIVAASENGEAAERVQDVFMNRVFRVYTNDDIKGVELSGALKNVIALAAGMCNGLGYGDNTKAALMTRGIAEIARLGVGEGCRPETFYGLAGIGDLIVTCTSRHSRNNRCGELLGKGVPKDKAIEEIGMVVEGIYAITSALELAKKNGIELPITEAVDSIVNHGKDPREAVDRLMLRDKKKE